MSVGDDELIVHRDVHLGYAVDLEFQGLMVPVVHNADEERLRALAREVADFAARARSKQLGPDDIAGGTFTITNVGSYGTTMTFPVINQPQIAILSTDGVKKRPVVIEQSDGSDAIAVRPTGLLALAWDHRAVDGAVRRQRFLRQRQGDHRDPGLAAGAGLSAGPASTVHLRAGPAHGVVGRRIASVGLISRGPSGLLRARRQPVD